MGNLLAYCNDEERYKYFVHFKAEEWKDSNCVTLIFDKKGQYIKKEYRVTERLRDKTKDETIAAHLSFASNYVQQAATLIKYFMQSFQKEEIKIQQNENHTSDSFLNIYQPIPEYSYFKLVKWGGEW